MKPFLWLLFSWRGRVNRIQFLIGYAAMIGVFLLFILTAGAALTADILRFSGNKAALIAYFSNEGAWRWVGVGILVLGLPTIVAAALQVKRLHDLGRSAWWLVGIMILLGGSQAFGQQIGALVGVAVFLAFVLLPTKRGPNDYGPSSRGRLFGKDSPDAELHDDADAAQPGLALGLVQGVGLMKSDKNNDAVWADIGSKVSGAASGDVIENPIMARAKARRNARPVVDAVPRGFGRRQPRGA